MTSSIKGRRTPQRHRPRHRLGRAATSPKKNKQCVFCDKYVLDKSFHTLCPWDWRQKKVDKTKAITMPWQILINLQDLKHVTWIQTRMLHMTSGHIEWQTGGQHGAHAISHPSLTASSTTACDVIYSSMRCQVGVSAAESTGWFLVSRGFRSLRVIFFFIFKVKIFTWEATKVFLHFHIGQILLGWYIFPPWGRRPADVWDLLGRICQTLLFFWQNLRTMKIFTWRRRWSLSVAQQIISHSSSTHIRCSQIVLPGFTQDLHTTEIFITKH